MKEILLQYASYNLWANTIFVDYIKQLPPPLQQAETAASFASIQKTLQHMWETETAWWKRLNLLENIPAPGSFEILKIEALLKSLPAQSETIMQWISNSRVEKLEHVIAYRNSKKVEYKQPVFQILMHLFNHQTYHRGQLVSIFRQLKLDNIPNSDFIMWSRKK